MSDRDRPADGQQWIALQELLPYLRSDESPRQSFARLDAPERHYFLSLMQASGWSVPPTHCEREENADD